MNDGDLTSQAPLIKSLITFLCFYLAIKQG